MEYLQNNVEEAVAAFNAIREEIVATGVEVEEGTKPRLLANKIPQVYDKGQDDLWDFIQDYGNRTSYINGFSNWGAEYIRPKYKVVPKAVNGVASICEYCKNLKKVEALYFDFSQKSTGTNNNTGYYYSFNGCSLLEEIEDIGLIPQLIYSNTFAYDYKLHTIAKLGTDENTRFSDAFIGCNELVNITIEGTIGQNGFDIHWSIKLSADSLKSIFNALSATTTGLTVTLPTTAQSNYEAVYGTGSWATLTATKSNWTIAYANA